MKQTIKQQKEFVKWLKDNKLYNPSESGHVMQKMHEVWAKALDK